MNQKIFSGVFSLCMNALSIASEINIGDATAGRKKQETKAYDKKVFGYDRKYYLIWKKFRL